MPAFAAPGGKAIGKVDQALLAALAHGAKAPTVIIAIQPGYRGAVRKALQLRGARIKAEHSSLNLLVATVHRSDVSELARSRMITALSLDGPVHADQVTLANVTNPLPMVTTTLRQTLGLPAVAPSTMNGSTGIGVALIDSGISPSADFLGRITAFYDFTNGRQGLAVAPFDDYGHGTHIAGLIGGSGILSNYAVQGIAPAVKLVGLKVLDSTGQGATSDVIAALQYSDGEQGADSTFRSSTCRSGIPSGRPRQTIRWYRPSNRRRPPGSSS